MIEHFHLISRGRDGSRHFPDKGNPLSSDGWGIAEGFVRDAAGNLAVHAAATFSMIGEAAKPK
jgi:hypothetical protein